MAATKSNSVLGDVIDSIFQPGVNRGVIVAMNCAFFGLFFILIYLLFATSFNIHVCALTVLSTLLFIAINWFIREATTSGAMPASNAKSSSKPRSPKKKKL